MNEKAMMFQKLKPVRGSALCEYSVIENKLATLYENQEKLYSLLKVLVLKIANEKEEEG